MVASAGKCPVGGQSSGHNPLIGEDYEKNKNKNVVGVP